MPSLLLEPSNPTANVSRGTKKQAINNLETNPAAAANPPLPQAFGCSGSISEGEGSKTAAGVRLVGLQPAAAKSTVAEGVRLVGFEDSSSEGGGGEKRGGRRGGGA